VFPNKLLDAFGIPVDEITSTTPDEAGDPIEVTAAAIIIHQFECAFGLTLVTIEILSFWIPFQHRFPLYMGLAVLNCIESYVVWSLQLQKFPVPCPASVSTLEAIAPFQMMSPVLTMVFLAGAMISSAHQQPKCAVSKK